MCRVSARGLFLQFAGIALVTGVACEVVRADDQPNQLNMPVLYHDVTDIAGQSTTHQITVDRSQLLLGAPEVQEAPMPVAFSMGATTLGLLGAVAVGRKLKRRYA